MPGIVGTTSSFLRRGKYLIIFKQFSVWSAAVAKPGQRRRTQDQFNKSSSPVGVRRFESCPPHILAFRIKIETHFHGKTKNERWSLKQ